MKTSKKILTLLLLSTLFTACSKNDDNNGGNCDTVCEYSLTSSDTPGTAAASIEGTHNLTMHFPDADSPYPEGTKATFTLMNNILTIEVDGEECITIKNPRLTTAGSTEVQFRDTCRDKISYDVSENNGALNEINISSTETGKWLGQFNNR
ncbi:hypothetical protein [Polaribacter sp. Hel1_85]|uniref:hypothetical protein n=1 Tax=Polaribacter sp. Hel1_85 TaxID=1250005 RepID=UPI00052D69B3|nr:hypothetical protein [Polaribacter sp. Hel1_85]KGL61952.1 hypothetical protein PHEL85_1739 [Polaribacter sp. Hel1_85]